MQKKTPQKEAKGFYQEEAKEEEEEDKEKSPAINIQWQVFLICHL